MKLSSNKALRDFASRYPDADPPLRAFRQLIKHGHYPNVLALRRTFRGVDKVGDRYVFNLGGNKYRLVAAIAFVPQLLWVKGVLTHAEYDKKAWK